MPSHSTICGQVAKRCHVEGCGKIVRRRETDQHIEDNMKRHFSLLQREKETMMWEVERVRKCLSTTILQILLHSAAIIKVWL